MYKIYMKLGTIILFTLMSAFFIFCLILLISLVVYTVNFVEWKNSVSCDEVKHFAWNSPLEMPSEIKKDEQVTRCYTFTLGGSSGGVKLFESGSYTGQEYFGNYTWDMLGIPHKV